MLWIGYIQVVTVVKNFSCVQYFAILLLAFFLKNQRYVQSSLYVLDA